MSKTFKIVFELDRDGDRQVNLYKWNPCMWSDPIPFWKFINCAWVKYEDDLYGCTAEDRLAGVIAKLVGDTGWAQQNDKYFDGRGNEVKP